MQEIYLHLHGYILHVTKTLIYRTFKTLQGKWRQKGRELRISYRGFPVSQEQIARRFTEREVPLAVERPYEAAEVERAREVLVQLLGERGHRDLDVKVETENIPPSSMGITFTAAKK